MANKRIVIPKDISLFPDFPMPNQYTCNSDFEHAVLAYWRKRNKAKSDAKFKDLKNKRRLFNRFVKLNETYVRDLEIQKSNGRTVHEALELLENHPFNRFFLHHFYFNPGQRSGLFDFIRSNRPLLAKQIEQGLENWKLIFSIRTEISKHNP